MAVTSFGVTTAEVLDKCPVGDSITATTNPVNTGQVEDWIDEGSAEMAAMVRKSGMDPDELSDDAQAQIAAAVRNYAVKEILQALGAVEEKWRQYKEKYRNAKEELDDQPSKIDGYTATVPSNIDTSSSKPDAEFVGTDYEF